MTARDTSAAARRDLHPEAVTALIEWYRSHRRDLPWRAADADPWAVLVSEFMLQQTPVARVLPRYTEWLARWPGPVELAHASDGDVLRAWASLGYPRRALWLRRTAEKLVERHEGRVPADLDDLLALPGVGAYTARAVLAFGYGRRVPVVDTNVRRVLARAWRGDGDAPVAMTRDLAELTELLPEHESDAAEFSAAMMELGALVCTARAPHCTECPIADRCRWRISGYPVYTGKKRMPQKAYEGSDRQVRGIILAALRGTAHPVSVTELGELWTDREQFDRAIASLSADDLIVPHGDQHWALP